MNHLMIFKKLSAAMAATACLSLLGAIAPAQAALITSPISLSSPKVIDFGQFGGQFQFTSGPVQIGGLVGEDVTWSTNGPDSVIGNGGYGLGDNGSWSSGRDGYTGSNSSVRNMLFTFNDGLKSAVGGFINYLPNNGSAVLIEALGEGGALLESYDLFATAPISTPGQLDAGAFRGIQRAANDIRALRVSNSFVVLDDLTFTTNSTPIPTPALLPGLIAMSVGVLRKRKAEAAKGDAEA